MTILSKIKITIFGCSSSKPLILGFLLSIGLVVSYMRFVYDAQNLNTQIFNFNETYSWKEGPEGIYRTDAYGNYDTILLSKDIFREFTMSFDAMNPRNCGIIFNYQDKSNFYFIYLNAENQSVLWGLQQEGRSSVLHVDRFSLTALITTTLTIKDQKASLTINSRPVASIDIPQKEGKLGLILNDAFMPRTAFSNIVLHGQTTTGEISLSSLGESREHAFIKHRLSLTILYLFMMGFSYYLASIYARLRKMPHISSKLSEVQDHDLSIGVVVAIHFGITILLFWPFVFKGQILVSSADNFGEIYPLFFLSKHHFAKILSGQSLCLWNPLTHNGLPFYSNHWNMIFIL